MSTAVASAKVADAGPLTCVQRTVKAGGSGRPSSVTVPSSAAVPTATTSSGPADTTGGSFGASSSRIVPIAVPLPIAAPPSGSDKSSVRVSWDSG